MNRIAHAALAASLSVPLFAFAQAWNVAPESQRCASKWRAGDERGSGNHMKNPQNVLRGARLIKTGEVIELGHVLGPQMAFFGTRIFNLHTIFFSSRRRHTRSLCDWSSDVCSSD